MTDKEILSMLERSLDFWANELARAYNPEVAQFRRGVVYGLQLAIEKTAENQTKKLQKL